MGTEKAYKLATQMGKAKLFYINKMDTEHADFHKVMLLVAVADGVPVGGAAQPVGGAGPVEHRLRQGGLAAPAVAGVLCQKRTICPLPAAFPEGSPPVTGG